MVAIGIPLKMYFNSIDPDVQSIYESGYMLVTSLYLSYTLLTIGALAQKVKMTRIFISKSLSNADLMRMFVLTMISIIGVAYLCITYKSITYGVFGIIIAITQLDRITIVGMKYTQKFRDDSISAYKQTPKEYVAILASYLKHIK